MTTTSLPNVESNTKTPPFPPKIEDDTSCTTPMMNDNSDPGNYFTGMPETNNTAGNDGDSKENMTASDTTDGSVPMNFSEPSRNASEPDDVNETLGTEHADSYDKLSTNIAEINIRNTTATDVKARTNAPSTTTAAGVIARTTATNTTTATDVKASTTATSTTTTAADVKASTTATSTTTAVDVKANSTATSTITAADIDTDNTATNTITAADIDTDNTATSTTTAADVKANATATSTTTPLTDIDLHTTGTIQA